MCRHFYSFVSQICHCWCPPFSAGDATIFVCFPGLSLLVSALFRWPCSISIHLFPGSVAGAAALFRWPCSISIHLSLMWFGACAAVFCPVHRNRFTSERLLLLCKGCMSGIAFLPHCVTLSALFSFLGKRWMNDRIGFRQPGLSLLVSTLVRWPCSISIHVSPRPVTGGVRPFPLATWHFYSFVSQVCHCWRL